MNSLLILFVVAKSIAKSRVTPQAHTLAFANEFLRRRRDDSRALLRGATRIPTLRESSNALCALANAGEIHCCAWV